MPSAYGRPTPVSRCRLGRSLKSWNRYRLRIFTLGHGHREPRRARAPYVPWIGAIAALLALCTPQVATAQLNENCTVSVLNRKVRVNHDKANCPSGARDHADLRQFEYRRPKLNRRPLGRRDGSRRLGANSELRLFG